ncbi:hypothetical protein LBMAG06_10030 [Actinomycetes bacterium]|nr:hypothetical protein LBMAG06_10030 [Actinomycetes bacterium]
MALMSASLYSLALISLRLFDAQQSQFAADASALACVVAHDDLAREIAEQNFAQIIETKNLGDKCVVVVKANRVVRRAVAVSVDGFDLPTLQR